MYKYALCEPMVMTLKCEGADLLPDIKSDICVTNVHQLEVVEVVGCGNETQF